MLALGPALVKCRLVVCVHPLYSASNRWAVPNRELTTNRSSHLRVSTTSRSIGQTYYIGRSPGGLPVGAVGQAHAVGRVDPWLCRFYEKADAAGKGREPGCQGLIAEPIDGAGRAVCRQRVDRRIRQLDNGYAKKTR